MKNGDRLTGEIKGMQHGELSFKSSYMKSSVSVNWEDVALVSSEDRFIVTLTSGEKITGVLRTATKSHDSINEIELDVPGETRNLPQASVIGLEQRESSFWKQLDGSIDLGFSYTSGNSTTDFSTSATAAYKTHKYSVAVSTSSQYGRSSTESTDRHTFTNQNLRMLTSNWFSQSYIDLLKSDQQKLALRSTEGGGFGRNIVQTSRTSLQAAFGAVYTHERYFQSAGGDVRSSGEMLLGMNFSTFRFKTTEVSSQLFVFPSFTEPGRVRMSTQSDLKFELVKDLYWSFHIYENFDSRPPVNAPRNDLGVTTSLGWKF